MPAILGEGDSLITQSYTGVLSVRDEQWKLVLDTKGSGGSQKATPDFQPLIKPGPWQFADIITGQLYDICGDPYETKDLHETPPEIVSRLIGVLTTAMDSSRTRP